MALEPEAFQKTQRYQVRATVPEVLAALTPKPERAPEPEPVRASKNTPARFGVGLLVAAGVLLAVLWLLPSDQKELASLAVLLFFFSLPGGILLLLASWMLQQEAAAKRSWPPNDWVVEPPHKDQRRLLLATLLKRFQVDLLADAPVDVTLDLTLPLDASKRVRTENLEGKRGPGTRADFVDPWLSLQGRFADGTHLHLSVVDQVRVVERMKVMPLKTRTKTKRSGVSLMTVALRVKPERHPGLATLKDAARSAVRLPPGARLKRVRVAEDRVALRVQLDEDWVARPPSEPRPGASPRPEAPRKTDASRTATMMLLSLYQVLNHSSSQVQPGKMRSTS
ncbi:MULTISPECIES: hypothetical protein [unclassified Corallococcus]|uniref:hypothetical protein n=1 Tax=unclassified Corallococcus TaxID=2685029 RepID=UPI001A8F5C92|nr:MULTISPECIES: hypothetical protein [unclassified Corallococcus]MBN9681194.1 hypothetical protein [Corallococcus sp. NCSPR001]WAS87225.1 hypothetical protein O0N60_09655 [Corallococcus sp. NCRR]